MRRPVAGFAIVCLCGASLASAQTPLLSRANEPGLLALARDLPPIDGPAAPRGGDVITRDDRGRATIRAVRLERPLRVDGRLDEEIYAMTPASGGFIQQLPREGQPATEQTEIWIFFDDNNVYVAARCYDSQPSRIVANELRRDSRTMFQLNDNLTVVFDTFYDRRNGFFFQTNPLGAVRDQLINLTRFNLQFPEKREFFLEGQGIFEFGGAGNNGGGNTPILFFSRRIGLHNGQAVPVIAGGRVAGKVGKFDVGALTVRTDQKASARAVATNFSVMRVRREVLRRSSVGVIATGRWPEISGVAQNAAVGIDADFRFFANV